MDAKTFTDLLKTPKTITGEHLKDLNGVIKAHPYCKSALLLYLAGLHQHDDKKYAEVLSQTIVMGKDKKMLHWIIDSFNDGGEAEPIPEKVEEKVIEKPKQEVKLEKPPEKEPEQAPEEAPEEDKNAKLKAIVEKRLAEIKKKKAPAKKEPEKEPATETPQKARKKPEPEPKPEPELEPEPEKGNDLIDKFIDEEPSISKPVGDYKHNIDLANKSSKDDDAITSETLAQIHLNQGNKKRAIEIYEQLILKNPEKSSYFAAQIEKISKKLK